MRSIPLSAEMTSALVAAFLSLLSGTAQGPQDERTVAMLPDAMGRIQPHALERGQFRFVGLTPAQATRFQKGRAGVIDNIGRPAHSAACARSDAAALR
ncbi:hypothetical protein, partial [Sphingobium yanoikuyae]|uniref:hypothetical protein n=1 Tax=Sphingobium yanoikuyae TaxID=13690 RepID=UPI00244D4E56